MRERQRDRVEWEGSLAVVRTGCSPDYTPSLGHRALLCSLCLRGLLWSFRPRCWLSQCRAPPQTQEFPGNPVHVSRTQRSQEASRTIQIPVSDTLAATRVGAFAGSLPSPGRPSVTHVLGTQGAPVHPGPATWVHRHPPPTSCPLCTCHLCPGNTTGSSPGSWLSHRPQCTHFS